MPTLLLKECHPAISPEVHESFDSGPKPIERLLGSGRVIVITARLLWNSPGKV